MFPLNINNSGAQLSKFNCLQNRCCRGIRRKKVVGRYQVPHNILQVNAMSKIMKPNQTIKINVDPNIQVWKEIKQDIVQNCLL